MLMHKIQCCVLLAETYCRNPKWGDLGYAAEILQDQDQVKLETVSMAEMLPKCWPEPHTTGLSLLASNTSLALSSRIWPTSNFVTIN